MAITSVGTEIERTAQGVELLLEHQSISSIESFARIALALRKERTVRCSALLNDASSLALTGVGTRTVRTMALPSMVPSLRISFCGRVVQQEAPVLMSDRRERSR